MSRFPRTFVRHEMPRATGDRTTGIYCRRCQREIIRVGQTSIRSVTMCQICLLKEQGIENPEEHVLTPYTLSADHNRIPVAVASEDELQGGVLMLDPEAILEETGVLPASGGVVGTVKGFFRAWGFGKPKKVLEKETLQSTPSLQRARSKRPKGLFEE